MQYNVSELSAAKAMLDMSNYVVNQSSHLTITVDSLREMLKKTNNTFAPVLVSNSRSVWNIHKRTQEAFGSNNTSI